MTGVSRSLFVPLSLAVGFAMIASFLLSSTLVPVLSVWLAGERVTRTADTRSRGATGSIGCANRLGQLLQRLAPAAGSLVTAYAGWSPSASSSASGSRLGREIFPPAA